MLASCIRADASTSHRFNANTNVLGHYQNSGKSWLDGGLSRYGLGNDAHDMSMGVEFNAAYRYQPRPALRFRVYAQAQDATSGGSATQLGLVEWIGRYRLDIDFNQQFVLKGGQFFLPTSMENINEFWESPYTISFSSLNSWIGEEFRPIGLDLAYRYHFDQGDRWSFAATPFWGNDSMGALLAYRGWSYGRQRTAYNDVIALPDLNSLVDGQPFAGQRDDGSRPFGNDLDGDPGYALRTQYLADRFSFSLAWIDNRGDTTLIDGEYAWRTKFAILGASWFVTEQFELLGEASQGSTTMGAGPGVDVSFYSVYLMGSYRYSDYRLSVRYDQFGIDDEDEMDQDSHEIGRSGTIALMWAEEESRLSAGAELIYLNSKRRKALAPGTFFEDDESVSVSVLMSYRF